MLSGRGFKEVYSLKGGIKAWDGAIAEGPVELNLDLVRGDEAPVEIIRLAYGMEQSLGGFYRTARTRTQDPELADLLEILASIEEKHKQYLLALYDSIEASPASHEAFEADVSAKVMEGGFSPEEFIKKNERFLESVPSVLDLSLMVESQALDLYLRFAGKTENAETRDVLYKIADEEKGHLSALGRLRDERA